MSTCLQHKPYYFLTDRETYYQYLIDNRKPKQTKKYLYYPQQYQKMSTSKIQKYRKQTVYKFFKWSLFNQNKLDFYDRQVINGVLINSLIIMGICAFGAKSFRKVMFRTQLPVLQIKLERIGFNVRILKSFISYITFTIFGYKFISKQLEQTYLVDIAFQYKNNFMNKMHSKVDDLFQQLTQERFNKKIQQQSI